MTIGELQEGKERAAARLLKASKSERVEAAHAYAQACQALNDALFDAKTASSATDGTAASRLLMKYPKQGGRRRATGWTCR
jgi:hypothetical protein